MIFFFFLIEMIAAFAFVPWAVVIAAWETDHCCHYSIVLRYFVSPISIAVTTIVLSQFVKRAKERNSDVKK